MKTIAEVHREIEKCKLCPKMCGTPVHGLEVHSKFFLIGQAPGEYEAPRAKPWAHTAGKTLFRWIHEATEWNEEEARARIYIGAMARCFPGKNKAGTGDRLPEREELDNCRRYIRAEMDILKPRVLIAVGKLAIEEILGRKAKLDDVVGEAFKVDFCGHSVVVLPLPHPSGRSTWIHSEAGKKKLKRAIALLRGHLLKNIIVSA